MNKTEKYIPKNLEISYKSKDNGNKSVKIVNNEILIINNSQIESINKKDIDKEKWIEFLENLEKIGIWDLEENYSSCSLTADYYWKIKIEYEEKRINSYGINVDPKIIIGNDIYSILEKLEEYVEDLIS